MSNRLALPALPQPLHEVFVDPTRHKVVNGPRQMGKDYLGFCYATSKAWAGGRGWWVSNVYANSDGSFKLFKHLLAGVDVVRVRESDREIRFPSGGSVTFKTADGGVDNLRGSTLDFLVGNEWAFANRTGETWNVVSPALAVKRGSVLLMSTADGVGNPWHETVLRGDPTHPSYDPDWKSWQFNASHSLFITPDELEKKRRTMPELLWRQEYNGEFVSGAGAKISRAWIKEGEPPARLTIALGVDLAASLRDTADYTAVAALGRDENGIVYVLDVQRMRASFADVLAFVKRMAEQWRPSVTGVEDFGFQKVATQELLRTSSLNVKPIRMQGDKVSKFSPLEVRYQQGQVIHAPGLSRDFIDELTAFPCSRHDDQVDACAVAFAALGDSSWLEDFERAWANPVHARRAYMALAGGGGFDTDPGQTLWQQTFDRHRNQR